MPMIKVATLALKVLLIAWLLQGCGRKGPLFMQQAPVKPATMTVAPAEKTPQEPVLSAHSQPVQTQTESQKQP